MMGEIIELYEDKNSAWRVLTSQSGTAGYRFKIAERLQQSTFAADARQLVRGQIPTGLEFVDLNPESEHGMELVEPCAMWKNGRVEMTDVEARVLTRAYISGKGGSRVPRR